MEPHPVKSKNGLQTGSHKTAKKLMRVFNVLRMSQDPAIIETLRASATPIEPENEAQSKIVPDVTSFDLESQIDENTTQ